MTPDEIASALSARFPAPYSLTLRQVAEAVLELVQPAPVAPGPPAPDDGALTREQAKALLVEEEYGLLKRTRFEAQSCQHCHGLHVRNCPAVSEIEYHPDGKVSRVVYFPHGQWPADGVLWLEDVIEAAQADDD